MVQLTRVISAAWLLLQAGMATAQAPPAGCDPTLIEEARVKKWPSGYAARNGQYCDGATFVPHSGGVLTVLGVVQGENPSLPAGGRIPIRLAATLAETLPRNSVVTVLGRDREPTGTWRLDGILTAAGLDLDPKPALEGLGMGLDRIAVRAQVGLDGEKWDVPVRVGQATGDQLAVWLRSPRALATLTLSILDTDNPQTASSAADAGSNIPPSQAFAVKLPASLRKGGRYLLTFVGDAGGRPPANILTARISLIVPR